MVQIKNGQLKIYDISSHYLKYKTIAKLLLNNMIPVNLEDAYIADISHSKYSSYYMNEIRYLRSKNIQQEIIKK